MSNLMISDSIKIISKKKEKEKKKENGEAKVKTRKGRLETKGDLS